MIRVPPSSSRTDTLFSYTSLFRSSVEQCLLLAHHVQAGAVAQMIVGPPFPARLFRVAQRQDDAVDMAGRLGLPGGQAGVFRGIGTGDLVRPPTVILRHPGALRWVGRWGGDGW